MVKKHYIFCAILALSFFACKKDNGADCFTSKGEFSQELRESGSFEHIELSSNIDLILTFDPQNPAIKVDAGKNLIAGIKTEIRDGRLVIWNTNKCNWVRTYASPMTVFVNVGKLKTLTYFGTGKIRSTNTLINDSLRIEVWGGSGLIDLDLDNKITVTAMNTGVADVRLTGKSDLNHIWVAGNGYYSGYELRSNLNYVQHFGTGECKIFCRDELAAKIFSSGNLLCKGNPSVVRSEQHGSGKLILE